MRKLALLLLLIPLSLCATNGFLPFGYGAKSRGMGGVGIAYPQESLVAYTNPAGMVWVGSRADIGGYLRTQNGRAVLFGVTPTEARIANKNLFFPELGINWNYSCNASLGLGLTTVRNVVNYNAPLSALGTTNLASEYASISLLPSWSMKVCPNHSIGIALDLAFTRIKFNGLESIALASENPDFVTNNGFDYEFGMALQIGWVGQLFNNLHFGATFRTPTWVGAYKKYQGYLANRGRLPFPPQVGVGVAYWIYPCVVATLDVVQLMWSRAVPFRNDADNVGLFGSPDGPGFGWHDQTVIKIGTAWTWRNVFTLRVGYNHADRPFTNHNTLLNSSILLVAKDHFTVGGTLRCGCNEWTCNYVMGFINNVDGLNSAPPDEVNLKQSSHAYEITYSRRW